MKIALLNPVARRSQGYHTIGRYIPQLGLQVLANLVPKEHTVDIIDEVFGIDQTETLLTSRGYELVGITAYSSGATRAYELAAVCRKNGIKCIMGGPHASAMPDEAQPHFDSVAVGECDEIWQGIIADAAAGKLAPRYQGRFTNLAAGYGAANQSIQPLNGKYQVGCIQTSRGCPVGCDFCSVTQFNGSAMRRRNVDEIIEEWNSTDKPFLFVVDDNFFGVGPKDAEWSKELCRQIIKRGKKRLWFSQTTMNMGNDPEGLKLAYKAGCRGMLVGIETFNADNLKSYRKGLNTKHLGDYKKLMDGFHAGGIAVFGAFIIGGDNDTEDTVSDTAMKAVQIGVDIVQITNLTPLPATKLYDRWMKEGRIFATNYPSDWERYTFVETVYNPAKLSARRLDETIYDLRRYAAGRNWVWKRTLRTLWMTKSLTTALFVHGMNQGFARMARLQVQRDDEKYAGAGETNTERICKIKKSFSLFPGKY